MRFLSCVFALAAFAATTSATALDDEISKIEATLAMLKVMKTAEENNKDALKFISTVAMASSSGSSTPSVNAGESSGNSEFDIEPQATRAPTEGTSSSVSSTSSSSAATPASSSSSTGSVEAVASASAASASASSSASTVVPTAFAFVSAVVYAML